MSRNPKSINEQLTLCDFYGGRFDGASMAVEHGEREVRFETRCGKVMKIACYVRVTPTRFCFEGYE